MTDTAPAATPLLSTLVTWREEAARLAAAAAEIQRTHVPLLVVMLREAGVPREQVAAAAGVTVARVDQMIAMGKAARNAPPAWYTTNACPLSITASLGLDPQASGS